MRGGGGGGCGMLSSVAEDGKRGMKKGKGGRNSSSNYNNGFLPNSLRIISSCLKTVSANATTVASTLKSAGASVAASISAVSDDHKEQVTWVGFDKLELSSSVCRHVLLLGYQNGFQVLDVDDASNFSELVSRRDDGPVTFLQMQPIPLRSNVQESPRKSFPLLLVVGGDESNCSVQLQSRSHVCGLDKYKYAANTGDSLCCSTVVRFYSLRSHCYVHALRFRSAVCMVRCSPRIVAVGLATQIYCFDALTLENKFSVLTYPVPHVGWKGKVGLNIGYGPMAVGPRWLAYASNDPLLVSTSRFSPQTLSIPSAVASPGTSTISGGVVAHYAMASSKQLAAGIVNLSDRGYKTFSKYCHEVLPDGLNSSPSLVSVSRATSSFTETSNAGVVVVKDFVSRAVISQFRAHSSPISALCFDPSGTLVVTASVYGNSIKIFRIMPSGNHRGSGSQSFDWNSSYVHLYKFHRGIRAAIIQDICFSRYSQWIAVVSSKGTCHVFILSPFGGDVGFQTLHDHHEEPSLAPVHTSPWWSASSCTNSQQSFSPPSAVTLSVVSRIRDNYSGLLNTVSNVAASVSGKVPVPSGALAAVFHNSIPYSQQVKGVVNPLENLLVYTPSGHVVQHEIRPSFMADSGSDSRPYSGSFVQSQDVELSINICPVQWWDVCRRSNWPEREDIISQIAVQRQECPAVSNYLGYGAHGQDLSQRDSIAARSNSMAMDLSRSKERSQLFLSNAEVQYCSGRLPVWQTSKISFCLIGPPRVYGYANGEYEIEKLPASEVEIRRKDLLPVFHHFHSMRSAPNDSHLSARRYLNSFPLELHHPKDKATEETIICHSKPASSSSESSDGGSSRRIHLLDLDHLNSDQPYITHYKNSHEYYHGGRAGVSSEFSPFDNKLGAAVTLNSEVSRNSSLTGETSVGCEVPALNTRLPPVGAADGDRVLPFDIGCPNGIFGLHNNNSDACDSRKDKFFHGGGIPRHFYDFSGVDKGQNLAGALNATIGAENKTSSADCNATFNQGNEEEEEKMGGDMFALLENDSEILEHAGSQTATETAIMPAISSCTNSRGDNLNQEGEEDDMLGGMFAVFGDDDRSLEPRVGQNDAEAPCATLSSTINSKNDDLDEDEDDMLGAMFAF